jgi:protein-arginine kinase activator protein McsA
MINWIKKFKEVFMSQEKICDICKKEVATIKLSQTTETGKKEAWICNSCQNLLKEKMASIMQSLPIGLFAGQPQSVKTDVPDFIKNAMSPSSELLNKITMPIPSLVLPPARLKVTCRFCAISLEDFLYQKYPGCIFCFYDFKNDIQEFIGSIFDKEKPSNKKPTINIDDEIKNLEVDMGLAAKQKRFMDAAKIRDKIESLRKKKKKKDE